MTGHPKFLNILKSLEALCNIFWGPNHDQCMMLISEELLQAFELLERDIKINFSVELKKLNTIIEEYNDPELLFYRLNEDYVRLFISHKDGIIAPIYESCYEYENAPLMGPSAVRMKNLFISKGLTLSDDMNEPPDHLCIEMEYLYFIMKEAGRGKESFELKEVRNFVSDIMLPWIEKFYNKLVSEVPDSFYTVSAFLLYRLLRSIQDISFLDREV